MSSAPPWYNASFYAAMTQAADYAARQVVPVILTAVHPGSVVDVGCGAGAWARAFLDAGVPDVTGVDGDWVRENILVIPAKRFVRTDLTRPFALPRRFDLCVCLETAEHLPEERADGFMDDLTRLSDVIAFSAAVPFQGGVNHFNERWQSYWVEKFAARGYVGVDYLRRRIWHLERYNTWFYAQNLIVYVRAGALSRYPELEAEYQCQSGPPISVVHPGLILLHRLGKTDLSVRQYFRMLPRMLGRAVLRLLGRPSAPPPPLPPGAGDWRRSGP